MKNNMTNKNITNFDFSSFYHKHKAYLPNSLEPSIDFLCWFVGFTEGEGSFIVNNRGDLCFVIVQSTSDIKILYYIKETLGFGKVISQSLSTSRFVTQNKKEIEIIISIFNGNLILPSRKIKLYTFIEAFNKWASKGRIILDIIQFKDTFILPSLDNYWLTGFVDGEGCFTCSILDKKGFSFNFNISQKGEINKVILEQLCKLFNSGKVSEHFYKGIYEYRISGVKACANTFHYFDKFTLLTKKSLSYILWKEVHKDLLEKNHLIFEKRLKMIEKTRIINNNKKCK